MEAREEILGRIRSAISDGPAVPEVSRTYRRTADLERDEVLGLMVDRLEDYKATVDRVSAANLPGTIAALLQDAKSYAVPHGLPAEWLEDDRLRNDDRRLTDAPGSRLAVDELDGISVVTSSAVSIAESGTIILDGSPTQGRRAISLVPDHHVCVVPASSIVQLLPEALPRIDPTHPLTWISGPSATSDIELERVEGVHGPRNLDVIIVTDL
ncbi:lactate utilization protein C [Arthrobacter sp. JSM 101049]|uniref:LutC/YkgG family protein n=1 Tax=Arthrobacter sp. JSM 101049 TaxID=929097 RepID=UPI00356182F9